MEKQLFSYTAHSPVADFSYDMSNTVTFHSASSGPPRYDGYSSSAQNSPIGFDRTHVLGDCPFCRQQPENFSSSRSDLPETQEVESSTRVTLSPEAHALAAGPKTSTASPTAQNQTEQTGENASQDQGQGNRDNGRNSPSVECWLSPSFLHRTDFDPTE